MKFFYLKLTFSFLLLLVCTFRLKAQDKVTVRGKVIDASDKQGVIGASVVELDKEKRVISGISTDINGNFALRVSNVQNSIQVTYIGYKTFLAGINGRSTIDIQLVPSAKEIDAVVIKAQSPPISNGTGMNIKEKDITGAVTTISTKDLEELSSASIDQALQGRMPGVDISATSGDPGAGMSIRIRGTSNINGSSNPLIVLDGMPYETEVPDDFNFGTADDQGYAQLLNIAPSDIKDITVLKDAASTAVWGSRAANGVLIINTKRGVIGRPILSYNFRGTASKQPDPLPMLSGDQYSMLIPEAIANRGGLPINSVTNPEFNYDPRDPVNFYNYNANTDWIKEISQIGKMYDNNISMQGGGEKARYYASLGYFTQTGTTVGTSVDRITTKINLDYTVSNRLRFRSDFSYTHVNNQLSYSSAIRDIAYSKMPNMSVYRYDDFGNITPVYFSPATNIQGFATLNDKGELKGTLNPAALANTAMAKQIGERIVPHFNLQYDVVKNVLMASYDIQFDINNIKTQSFLPQIATGRPATEAIVNRAVDNDGDAYAVDTKLNLLFTPRFNSDKHTLQSLLSVQTSDAKNLAQNITTSNSASSFLQDVADDARVTGANNVLKAPNDQVRLLGLVLTNQYSLLDRYIINVGARLDGNSKLSRDSRFGLFPSFSGRWRISGEPFMRKFTFVDDLSLRASYGLSGTTPKDNYKYFNTYNPTPASYGGSSAIVAGNIGLDDLRWQTKTGRNVGINLWLLKSRIKIDAEVYNDKTKQLIFDDLVVPAYTGYSKITANVGSLENKGFEIGINTIPYRSKKLMVGFDFNVARNVNTITSISEMYPRTDGKKINENGVYRTYLQVGNPFGSFYGLRYKGVYSTEDATIATDKRGEPIVSPTGDKVRMRFNYPNTNYIFQAGDAIYEDINHDGNINEDDIVYLGNGIPKLTGGFGPNVTINGNLKVQAFFAFKAGYDLINETLMKTSNMFGTNNQSTVVNRRWRNPGDVTDVPRALQNMGYNWMGSDRYVSDASFIRLRSVTVRYNLNKRVTQRLGLRNASCFVTGENLYMWTNYLGVEPDVSSKANNNPFSYNVDKALTPQSRNVVLGITVGY